MKKFRMMIFGLTMCTMLGACGNGSAEEDSQMQGSSMNQEVQQTQRTEPAGSVAESDMAGESTGMGDEGADEALGWSDEMNRIKAAVTEKLGEEYWPDMPVEPEVLADVLGITSGMYDDYMGEMPVMSAHVDMLVVVKVKEGQIEAVEDALNAYRDTLVNDTMQYPMNLGKIQASRIERIGNHVCFVQLGGTVDHILEQGDDAVIKHCLDQNEIAIDAIRSVVVK